MSCAAIIGTGLIGRGWATVFARAGWGVRLWDRDMQAVLAAKEAVAQSLTDLEAAGLATDAGELARRVRVAGTLAEAVSEATYVQESVPEKAEIKGALMAEIDAAAPGEALIGSSSSTIPGSRFLSSLPGRARAMVAHPANPPHLMPVVEIAPSPWHSDPDVDRFVDLLSSIGQVPVIVRNEVEGFVMNRLQTAVVNEAVALVAQGVIDPAGLDAVMKHSLGLRWALMGPFETMDLNAPNGFLDYATRYGALYQAMGKSLSVADPWPDTALQQIESARRAATPQERVGQRMRWRDQALMRLLAMRSELEKDEQKQEGRA